MKPPKSGASEPHDKSQRAKGGEIMTKITYRGKTIELDDDGFLADIDAWDESTAAALAEKEGTVTLSKEMLDIIAFMRAHYLKYHAFPILRAVCKNLHQPKECVSEHFIDPMKAWKIAGLPNPEVIATGAADEAGKLYRIIVGD